MSALVCLGVALVAFGLGFALGRRKVAALRTELAAQHQLVADLEDQIGRLRLSALVPPRRQP